MSFFIHYKNELEKIGLRKSLLGKGRELKDVRESLSINVKKHEILTSVIKFIKLLSEIASHWYISDEKNIKMISYNKIIAHLSDIRVKYEYLGDKHIEEIIMLSLKISLLIRGKKKPEKLEIGNIGKTSTARGFFKIIKENKFSFEKLTESISLDKYRKPNTEDEKYKLLIDSLTGPKGLEDISCLYDEKYNTMVYSQVQVLIDSYG
ncbi:hypothetical protein [Piscirickettsia litoralis]|uniref:DUF4145 domain-containing protein n=1 Tax=Piscirickettsia litoralis TaxID=1891921 RepID=A0ABX3A1R4_9GAMM|nr:hypothetical protein [Piscirickettsia litoralis]ODN42579.1 hypothetical protein BGC07_06080 [Piscirickettsia litoralis]